MTEYLREGPRWRLFGVTVFMVFGSVGSGPVVQQEGTWAGGYRRDTSLWTDGTRDLVYLLKHALHDLLSTGRSHLLVSII